MSEQKGCVRARGVCVCAEGPLRLPLLRVCSSQLPSTLEGSRIPNARFLEPERSQARASSHCTQGPGAPALQIPRAQPPQSKPEFPSCLTPPQVPCHSQSEPFRRPCFASTPHRAVAVAALSTRVANPEVPAPSSSPALPPAAECSHAPSFPLFVTAPSLPILSPTCPPPLILVHFLPLSTLPPPSPTAPAPCHLALPLQFSALHWVSPTAG